MGPQWWNVPHPFETRCRLFRWHLFKSRAFDRSITDRIEQFADWLRALDSKSGASQPRSTRAPVSPTWLPTSKTMETRRNFQCQRIKAAGRTQVWQVFRTLQLLPECRAESGGEQLINLRMLLTPLLSWFGKSRLYSGTSPCAIQSNTNTNSLY